MAPFHVGCGWQEIGIKPHRAIACGAEDYFVYDAHRGTRSPDEAERNPGYTLHPQHIPMHAATVEMEERHHGVMMERAGGEALLEFVQDISGHGMQIGERLRSELDPGQLHQFGLGMDHALDPMGNRRSVRREEPGVEASHPAGRGDGTRDQVQSRWIRQQARFSKWLPWAFERRHRAAALAAETEAGFLAGFADRGDRQRTRAR